MTVIRPLGLVLLALAVVACEPVEPEEKGPPLEIVEAARKLDTTRVMMRYKNGGEIAPEDETRAVMRAMEVACVEGESAIPDTRTRTNGLLQVNIFCVGVLETGEVIDGSRLKS